MAEDTADQGTPSALRPRPGWDKAAHNPDAVHGPIDPASVPSSGYATSYQPQRASSPLHSDGAEAIDQSAFLEEQQGHKLGRTNGAAAAAGTTGGRGPSDSGPATGATQQQADGRPAWDGRFHLERAAWEMAPRSVLLRPPSPGSSLPAVSPKGASDNRRTNEGNSPSHGGFSDGGSQGPRMLTGADGLEPEASGQAGRPGSVDGFGARTTILPGLNATSPAIRTSPYSAMPGAPGSPGPDGPAAPKPAAKRASVTNLAETYVGRAYSPAEQQMLATDEEGAPAEGAGTSEPGAAPQDGAEADGEGGVDGRGTHLPALTATYFGRPGRDAKVKDGASTERGRKASEKAYKIGLLGAVYMPGKKLEAASARRTSKKQLGASARLYPYGGGSGGSGGSGSGGDGSGGPYGGGGGTTHRTQDRGIAGPWRPSGVQHIPEDLSSAPLTSRPSRTLTREEQLEADKRRAAPRDPSIFSPERYPLVGQGWFLPPEKFPPNPAYADVRSKYLETKNPHSDTEADGTTPRMPDIHLKPWLTPGKHLVTDSSAPAPKMSGTAGARPSYNFSPGATVTSPHSTLRSGTARSVKGKGKGKPKPGGAESYSGSGSDNEPDADRVMLAVIGGVRLMSMTRRHQMMDEAMLEAAEDAQFKAEDEAAAEEQRRSQGQLAETDGAGKQEDAPQGSAKAAADAEEENYSEEEPQEKRQEAEDEPEQEQAQAGDEPEEEDDAPGPGRPSDGSRVQRSSSGPRGERSTSGAGGGEEAAVAAADDEGPTTSGGDGEAEDDAADADENGAPGSEESPEAGGDQPDEGGKDAEEEEEAQGAEEGDAGDEYDGAGDAADGDEEAEQGEAEEAEQSEGEDAGEAGEDDDADSMAGLAAVGIAADDEEGAGGEEDAQEGAGGVEGDGTDGAGGEGGAEEEGAGGEEDAEDVKADGEEDA